MPSKAGCPSPRSLWGQGALSFTTVDDPADRQLAPALNCSVSWDCHMKMERIGAESCVKHHSAGFRRPPSPVLSSREPLPSLGLKTHPLSLPSIFPSRYWVLWFVTYRTRSIVTIKSSLFIKTNKQTNKLSSSYVFQIPNLLTSLPSPPTCNTQKRKQKTPTIPLITVLSISTLKSSEGLFFSLHYTMHHSPSSWGYWIERRKHGRLLGSQNPINIWRSSSLFISCLKKKTFMFFLPSN